jgi:IMP dehydrogenase
MAKVINNTNQDHLGRTFDDVLLRPQYSELTSRKDADITSELVPGLILKNPLMPVNMQAVNSIALAVSVYESGSIATIDQFSSIEKTVLFVKEVKAQNAEILGAVGVTKDYLERAKALIQAGVKAIVIDTPHAHSKITQEAILNFKKQWPKMGLIVGNVGTSEAAEFLFELGVDCVKVGVGPGAACTTRVNTGTGMPQLTAIMECFEVAKKYGKTILADGGIKQPGDFAKAIAAGGSAAYAGSIFAGTVESPSELIEKNGKQYKKYWGSASSIAREMRAKNDDGYKADTKKFIEGAEGLVPYQGSVKELMERYADGLKSAMSFSGSFTIKEFQDKAVFLPITAHAALENTAHGLI